MSATLSRFMTGCWHCTAAALEFAMPVSLASALARPRQHLAHSTEADLVVLAAVDTAGISEESHPFVDGNKRTGFITGILFLELNGFHFRASEEAAAQADVGACFRRDRRARLRGISASQCDCGPAALEMWSRFRSVRRAPQRDRSSHSPHRARSALSRTPPWRWPQHCRSRFTGVSAVAMASDCSTNAPASPDSPRDPRHTAP